MACYTMVVLLSLTLAVVLSNNKNNADAFITPAPALFLTLSMRWDDLSFHNLAPISFSMVVPPPKDTIIAKRRVSPFALHKFPPSQSENEADSVFEKGDKDKSGGLGHWELYDSLSDMDFDVTPEICLVLLKELVQDNNGVLDRGEYLSLVQDKFPRDVCAAFVAFSDKRGFLTVGKLKKALQSLGDDLNVGETKALLQKFDANGDGKIGPLGFAEIVSRSPIAQFWKVVDPSSNVRRVRSGFIKAASAAPKKPVSFHSVLSGMSFIAGLVILLPAFHPGFDVNGGPQLFNSNTAHYSDDFLWQIQFCAVLQLVSATLGVFRLPPNSPWIRVHGMAFGAIVTVLLDLTILSSLNGTGIYLIDAYSSFGSVLLGSVCLGSIDWSLKINYYTMADKDMKGWDTMPNTGSRGQNLLFAVYLSVLLYTLVQVFPPILGGSIRDAYDTSMIPYFSEFNGPNTLQLYLFAFGTGTSALLATLIFEKKISPLVASFFDFFGIVILQVDFLSLVYYSSIKNEKFFFGYLDNIQMYHNALDEKNVQLIYTIVTALSFSAGFWKFQQDKQSTE